MFYCIYYLGQPKPGVRLQSKYWFTAVFRQPLWKQTNDIFLPPSFPCDAHQYFWIPLHHTSRHRQDVQDNGETNKRANGIFSFNSIKAQYYLF